MTWLFQMNEKIIVARLVELGSDKNAFVTTGTFFTNIQPIAGEAISIDGGVTQKIYTMIISFDNPIKDGDRITRVKDNKQFEVVGVERHDELGAFQHLVVTIVEINA